MRRRPIVVGIDGSSESRLAARKAWAIARSAGTECHLVHATRDVWAAVRSTALAAVSTAGATPQLDVTALHERLIGEKQTELDSERGTSLPDVPSEHLHVRVGRSTTVLQNMVHELDAGLVVLGGKHHAAPGRWVVGSTAHQLVRTLDVPILVTGDAPATIGRVLVAVDLSEAARVVIEEAQRFAAMCEGSLLALHVVEILPGGGRASGLSQRDFFSWSKNTLEDSTWTALTLPHADRAVRQGPVIPTIMHELRDWNADVLVVGSHGGGGQSQMLIGGTTEALLNDLPASMLIVPITGRRHEAG